MSTCCREPGCRRRQPITFYLADLFEPPVIFAATRSEPHSAGEDGRVTMRAIERHEVTGALRAFILREREYVLSVLAERTGQ